MREGVREDEGETKRKNLSHNIAFKEIGYFAYCYNSIVHINT